MAHKAGFVSIIGKPNVGKSTLMNALIGEQMSIITPKAQTTRHRIKGILNTDDYQIVFSDTPGVIKPHYGMHESMMTAVEGSIVDADIVLLVTDINEKHDEGEVLEKLKNNTAPLAILINKIDKSTQEWIEKKAAYWRELLNPTLILAISAKEKFNVEAVLGFILEHLPEHPPYYEKDELSDRNLRFFVSEMIREKIFLTYQQEIPYSTEVIIRSFKEEEKVCKISAEIIVERESQKGIIIGKGGEMLKLIGSKARIDIEAFIDQKVYLELFVKVVPDWRNKKLYLKNFGYEN